MTRRLGHSTAQRYRRSRAPRLCHTLASPTYTARYLRAAASLRALRRHYFAGGEFTVSFRAEDTERIMLYHGTYAGVISGGRKKFHSEKRLHAMIYEYRRPFP